LYNAPFYHSRNNDVFTFRVFLHDICEYDYIMFGREKQEVFLGPA